MGYIGFFLFSTSANTYIYTYCHALALHVAFPNSYGEPRRRKGLLAKQGLLTLLTAISSFSASSRTRSLFFPASAGMTAPRNARPITPQSDRKSTRLNSSH